MTTINKQFFRAFGRYLVPCQDFDLQVLREQRRSAFAFEVLSATP